MRDGRYPTCWVMLLVANPIGLQPVQVATCACTVCSELNCAYLPTTGLHRRKVM